MLDDKTSVGYYDMQFVKPIDETLLHEIFKSYQAIITIEDGTIVGGFASSVLAFANAHHYKQSIVTMGIDDQFIEHATVHQLQQLQQLDALSIKKEIENLFLFIKNS